MIMVRIKFLNGAGCEIYSEEFIGKDENECLKKMLSKDLIFNIGDTIKIEEL